MSKRESYADQVISLRGEVERLNAELAAAKKSVEHYKSNAEYAGRQRSEAVAELDSAHDAVDSLPTAPPRTYTKPGAYGETQRQLSARLLGYFASKG